MASSKVTAFVLETAPSVTSATDQAHRPSSFGSEVTLAILGSERVVGLFTLLSSAQGHVSDRVCGGSIDGADEVNEWNSRLV